MHRFRVEVISKTDNPQTLIYKALHQDYSDSFVFDQEPPTETRCGEIAVERLLKGDRGHYGCLEHPSISFACGWFPHSVMQQARTHRVNVSFDVQSFRYTSNQFIKVMNDELDVEDVFYLRPVGKYHDRKGNKYFYDEEQRNRDLEYCIKAIENYVFDLEYGLSPEHARGKLPFDYRQHFVVTFNLRSLLHFIDVRFKKDAQLEIQQLCELMFEHVINWTPQIAVWYEINRLHKAKLAP